MSADRYQLRENESNAMEEDSILPADLVGRAFSASNGELGWLKHDAIEAARLIASSRRAILGGEVWLIGKN